MVIKKDTDERLLEALADSARPIDFNALTAEGLIVPDGNWYLVPDLKKLPRHAQMKVIHPRQTKKGLKVQFREPRRDIIAVGKQLNRKRKT